MSLALAEPISCCLNGMDNYRVEVGDVVVIVGAGPIGLIHLQLARIAGAAAVVVSDPSATRRASAEALGATVTVDPTNDDLSAVVNGLSAGEGADVAVLCIGVPELVNDCLGLVRKRGRVSIFAGLAGEGWSNIAANLIHYRELTVVGASNSGRERKKYSRPSSSPGRGARVVAETEKRKVGSQAMRRLASVDFPAPDGDERMMSKPLRFMVIPRSEPVRASGR